MPRNLSEYYKSDEYISHNEEGGLLSFVYKTVQGITLSGKRRLVSSYAKGKRLADYGAGKGDFLSHMKHNGYETSGFEPDADARALAKQKHGIDLHTDNKSLPEELDAITMWHVLEHVPNPAEVIADIKSKLSKDGVLFVAVPNFESYDASYYKQYWAAYDVPRHLLHFSTSSMKHLIENEGFEIIDIKPMWFDSTYVSILSEKYKSNDTGQSSVLNIPRAVFIGLLGNIATLFNKKRCSSLIYVIKPQ